MHSRAGSRVSEVRVCNSNWQLGAGLVQQALADELACQEGLHGSELLTLRGESCISVPRAWAMQQVEKE